jgi:Fur family ferric uptake transcriptional regulator
MRTPEAETWLRLHDFRVTRARVALVQQLSKAKQPRTLAELHAAVRQARCDFATVFRFVEKLELLGLVRTHFWQDRTPHYEWAGHASSRVHDHHHHHVVCRSCSRVEEIDACTLGSLEKLLQDQKGFTDLTHSLEFFGICPQCQLNKTIGGRSLTSAPPS